MTAVVELKKAAGSGTARSGKKKAVMAAPERVPEKLYYRRPWSGTFDPAELVRPGGKLMAALVGCAYERGQRLQEVAEEFGVTYGYLNQLQTGNRKTANIVDEFAEKCAAYLGIPTMTVLFLAGKLKTQYAYEKPNLLEVSIPRAINFIMQDPDYGPLMTAELLNGSFETQYLFVILYQKATGYRVLPAELEALDPARLAKELEAVELARMNRLKQLEQLRESSAEDN